MIFPGIVLAFGVTLAVFGMVELLAAIRTYNRATVAWKAALAEKRETMELHDAKIHQAIEALADRVQDGLGVRP